jgi:hypothetical protein
MGTTREAQDMTRRERTEELLHLGLRGRVGVVEQECRAWKDLSNHIELVAGLISSGAPEEEMAPACSRLDVIMGKYKRLHSQRISIPVEPPGATRKKE